jgi:hypothetical protein
LQGTNGASSHVRTVEHRNFDAGTVLVGLAAPDGKDKPFALEAYVAIVKAD